jgi:phasin family protein
MNPQEMSKLFDPSQLQQNFQQMAQQWQKMMNMPQLMSHNQSGMDAMKQVSSLWADTVSKCSETQLQYCQSSMEDCIGAMKELSTAKGLEDYVQKQTKMSQKAAEKAQAAAQELASQWQKTQTQCTDLISQAVMQGMSWSKPASTSAK